VIRELCQAILRNDYWITCDARRALQNITLEMLTAFVDSFYDGMFVEGLVEGNMFPEVAYEHRHSLLSTEYCVNCVNYLKNLLAMENCFVLLNQVPFFTVR
jgi:secreted Zn-dependent insulinase-like peptidase